MNEQDVVELDLPSDVLFELMLQAHEQDITLNQLVNRVLQQALDQTHKGAQDAGV